MVINCSSIGFLAICALSAILALTVFGDDDSHFRY